MNSASTTPTECYQERLHDCISLAMSPIMLYFETLEDCNENIAFTGQALYENAERKIDEAMALIKKHIGDIKINKAAFGNSSGTTPHSMVSCQVGRRTQE